ncbi:MAG: hypothetical protein CVU62_13250 [Deltaproteobacteria bacterium HGW-Deltaproteobacteria-2]|jgi:hypothetical protein|nr:MAG: hypothetical protein CVU62_13250 [Deltaproteobacteria bacterium HGW-Deltaproteobacteria-2]
MSHKSICKRGHSRTGKNLDKWGHCRKCANMIRRHPKERMEYCKRGHKMTPQNTSKDKHHRCLICREKLQGERNRLELRDTYVRCSLKLPKAMVPPELIELARLNITLKREARNHGN